MKNNIEQLIIECEVDENGNIKPFSGNRSFSCISPTQAQSSISYIENKLKLKHRLLSYKITKNDEKYIKSIGNEIDDLNLELQKLYKLI